MECLVFKPTATNGFGVGVFCNQTENHCNEHQKNCPWLPPRAWSSPLRYHVGRRWNASVGSPVCAVHGYEVISEVLNSSSEVNASLVLLSLARE